MLRCMYGKGTMRFLEEDKGGGGGGEGSGGQQQQQTIATPFDNLAWDELDDETKGKFEKAKAEFIATSQQNAKDKAALEHQTGLARRFQSETDRLTAELNKGKQLLQDVDPILTEVTAEFKAAGYKDEDVVKLAPTLAKILKKTGDIQRADIGKALAPLATTVLANDATNAFEQARSQVNDPLGYLQDNEIAEKVWAIITDRVSKGMETTPAVVTNLARMQWAESMEQKALKGEEIKMPTASSVSRTPTGMNMPRFSFPGAGNNGLSPAIPPTRDLNVARTTLNEDTQNALAETFSALKQSTGLAPKAFPGKGKK